jgi:hypothetical protein
MLKVFKDASSSSLWATFFKYDMAAEPTRRGGS